MKQNKIEKFLGKEDAVSLQRLSKRIFKYKCPECSYKKTVTNLRRHLEARHKWSKEQAQLEETRRRVIYLWFQGSKHQKHIPLPCELCNIWLLRLDNHLKRHKGMTSSERKKILMDKKMEYWPLKAKEKRQVCQNYYTWVKIIFILKKKRKCFPSMLITTVFLKLTIQILNLSFWNLFYYLQCLNF